MKGSQGTNFVLRPQSVPKFQIHNQRMIFASKSGVKAHIKFIVQGMDAMDTVLFHSIYILTGTLKINLCRQIWATQLKLNLIMYKTKNTSMFLQSTCNEDAQCEFKKGGEKKGITY